MRSCNTTADKHQGGEPYREPTKHYNRKDSGGKKCHHYPHDKSLNFMKKNLDGYGSGEAPFSITLKGTSGHSESYSEYSALNALTNPESEKYIKPFSKWRCTVKKNKNDIITEVIFSKKQ